MKNIKKEPLFEKSNGSFLLAISLKADNDIFIFSLLQCPFLFLCCEG
ncbi:Uncharacterised protein [Porphyromonas macacae]|uniref:Uncharacterized protein n=1 Tax=Porphyromonas macacae TaxID=28115 RepID=A0A379DFB3_9PORP|nr:Uncharacterised protein [Porphyromonas macacae]